MNHTRIKVCLILQTGYHSFTTRSNIFTVKNENYFFNPLNMHYFLLKSGGYFYCSLGPWPNKWKAIHTNSVSGRGPDLHVIAKFQPESDHRSQWDSILCPPVSKTIEKQEVFRERAMDGVSEFYSQEDTGLSLGRCLVERGLLIQNRVDLMQ